MQPAQGCLCCVICHDFPRTPRRVPWLFSPTAAMGAGGKEVQPEISFWVYLLRVVCVCILIATSRLACDCMCVFGFFGPIRI